MQWIQSNWLDTRSMIKQAAYAERIFFFFFSQGEQARQRCMEFHKKLRSIFSDDWIYVILGFIQV